MKKQNNTMIYINFLQKKQDKETVFMEVKTRKTSCQGGVILFILTKIRLNPNSEWGASGCSLIDDRGGELCLHLLYDPKTL